MGKSIPGAKPNTGSIAKMGGFEYVGPDQKRYRIDYIAGEGGFQAVGAHLPTPPPQLPEYAALQKKYPQLFA